MRKQFERSVEDRVVQDALVHLGIRDAGHGSDDRAGYRRHSRWCRIVGQFGHGFGLIVCPVSDLVIKS